MAKIEIHNVESKITGMTNDSIRAVDRALAVRTPNCEFNTKYREGTWDGMTRFFKVKSQKFPTGLLVLVVKAIKSVGETYELEDKRTFLDCKVTDKQIHLNDGNGTITLRDYQQKAVEDSLKYARGVINVATNGGKTEIACGIIKYILPELKKGKKIAFFTHSTEIFTQSHKRMEERLGIKVGRIGQGKWEEEQVTIVMIPTISKYITMPKKLTKNKKLKELESIVEDYVERYTNAKGDKKNAYKTLYEKARLELTEYEQEQWDKIKEKVAMTKKFNDSVVGMICDEVHHASSTTWYKLFMKMKNAYYRIGLTGTIDESNPVNVSRLFGCTGRVISKVTNNFLIDKGYSAKPVIYMLEVKAPQVIAKIYQDIRYQGIINCDKRNTVFVNKVVERANSGRQCLIIVNEIQHGDIVSGMLEDTGVSFEFIHGDCTDRFREEALHLFKTGELQVLVATSILDEGVDVSGINCLFLMAGGKSMRQLLQRIGRGLRKKDDGSEIEVYDSLDYHDPYLTSHTAERYETYKSEGFEITKIPNKG